MPMSLPLPQVENQPASFPPIEHQATPEDSFSFLEILTVLARGKWLIFRSTLGAAVLATGLSYLVQPKFTATTTLLPPQSASSGSALLAQLGSEAGALGSLGAGSLGMKSPVDMYVSLMKSETVEDAVIRRFDLAKEYHQQHLSILRTILEKQVTIEAGAKDGLVRISATDKKPQEAADLANGYVEEYRKLSSRLAVSEAGQRRLFFEEQLNSEKDKLAKAEEELKQTEQSTGLVEMDSQAKALIQEAGTLRGQIAAKEVQIASMRSYAGEGNVDLLQAEQELAGLRTQLARLGGNDSEDNLMVSKGKLPEVGLEYVRKLREVKYNETLFDILARQFESAKLDEAKEGAPIQVVDMATVPDRKSSPHRPLFLLVGLIGGALFSCLWVVLHAALEEDHVALERWMTFRQALLGRKA